MKYPFSTFRIQVVFQSDLFRHHASFIREQVLESLHRIASARSIRIIELPDPTGFVSAMIQPPPDAAEFPGTPAIFRRKLPLMHTPLLKGYFSWRSFGGFSYQDHMTRDENARAVPVPGTPETWLIGEILSYLASFNAAYEEDLWLNLEFCVLRESMTDHRLPVRVRQAVS